MSKYAQARGKKGMLTNKQLLAHTAENPESNPLQRLMQAPPRSRPVQRPATAGKKTKTLQRPQTAKPRQPAQSYKQFIAL